MGDFKNESANNRPFEIDSADQISSSQQAAHPASLLLVTMLVSAQIGAQLLVVSIEIDITLYSLLRLRPVRFPAVVGIIKC